VDLDNRGLDQLNRTDHQNEHRRDHDDRRHDWRDRDGRGWGAGRGNDIVRPSCPPGTSFNGQHCIILDKRKIRPGGKGTINPCPNNMHLSGDRCVY
jgi:hypothetical protein